MKPAFRITLDGTDLTPKIKPRLISLTLTECRGNEADQLDLTLDDADGKLAIPPRGAQIALMIGWAGQAMVDKGTFTVDEAEHSGAPDQIIIRARTANLIDSFRQLRERSFHDTTVGAIIAFMAFEHELKDGVAAALQNKPIAHVDQTNESDASFLRRLGKQYDAVATVKNDTLIFAPASHSKTVSGKDLPAITIRRQAGDHHRYHTADRDSYSGVRAYWHDQKRAARRSVMAGLPGNSKRLRTSFATEHDARAAAKAEWQRIQRGIYTLELDLALGVPTMLPQSPIQAVGFKSEIDATAWMAVKISHHITKGGYTTHLEAETKTELAATEQADDHDPDEGITGVSAAWADLAAKGKGEELVGEQVNVKKLKHVYSTQQSAKRAVRLEWGKIVERREIIRENSEM